MISGWDETGPGLYHVDSEGGRPKGTGFSVGSGSPNAYGVLDNGLSLSLSLRFSLNVNLLTFSQFNCYHFASAASITFFFSFPWIHFLLQIMLN